MEPILFITIRSSCLLIAFLRADKTLPGVPHGAAAYRKGIPQAVFPSLVCRDRTDVHKNSRSSPDGNADQYLPICHHGQIASRWDS